MSVFEAGVGYIDSILKQQQQKVWVRGSVVEHLLV